ncbi:MAG TPA: RNA chaperone Hfq [Acidobacteriaceae bacterium]
MTPHADAAHDTPEATLNGNRKLIRPRLPVSAVPTLKSVPTNGNLAAPRTKRPPVRLQHAEITQPEPSHAEVFYYQKQVQAQTPMVVVLDDGDRLEGIIEWFDKDAVKLRLTTLQRILIYKSSIKFIYKTGENAPA